MAAAPRGITQDLSTPDGMLRASYRRPLPALAGGVSGCIQSPLSEAKPQERFVGKQFKEIVIYLPTDANVTVLVTREDKPVVNEQEEYLEDERQQMLDDYD
ncbi:hypothetical protein [Bradyrhizobium sp. USDA 4473]